MGATRTLNAKDIDVPAAVRELTGGQGADASFEVVGHGSTVMTAIRSLRKGGTVVLIGNLSPKVEIPLQEVVSREISVLGSCASSGEIPECIDLLARGAVDVDPLISLKASLDEGAALFERLYGGDKTPDESHHSAVTHGPSIREISHELIRSHRQSRHRHRREPRARTDLCAGARARRRRPRHHQPHAGLAEAVPGRKSRRSGRRAVPLELDVRDEGSIRRMVSDAAKAFGRIDILVNNAGCNVRKPAVDVTWDDWNLILDTNLRGAFFVAQSVAKQMIPNGRGRIINIGSVTSVMGYAGLGPYGASRGGIRQLTMSLADDWGPHGITVNCLAPGWFKTEQNKVMYEDAEWVAYLVDRIPMRRPGTDERSRRARRVSRVGRQRVHHRADAAGRRRDFDGRDEGAAKRSSDKRRRKSEHRGLLVLRFSYCLV